MSGVPAPMRRLRGPGGQALTTPERIARGRAARVVAPRSSHGKWAPVADRPDPVALLEEQGESRVRELVPVRYGRMLESPFTFFRGAALIMAADLALTPRAGITVQLCGDAHLSNFGAFASPETSTRRCRVRGSGTRSGLLRASRLRGVISVSAAPIGARL